MNRSVVRLEGRGGRCAELQITGVQPARLLAVVVVVIAVGCGSCCRGEDMFFLRHFMKKPEYGPVPFYRFYTNALRSQPDDALLSEMHNWFGNFRTLEDGHGA